jgi:SRSO17 transposase
LSSQKNYTLINFAEHLSGVTHDEINRYLNTEKITSKALWLNVKKVLEVDEDGYLVFDDTVLDKRHSQKIELVRKQYSGNAHQIIRGIGVVSCVYINSKTGQFWVIDYRVYAPEQDGKTKLDHLEDILRNVIFQKQLSFKRVLMDSWYATQRIMALIDNWEKIYYCPLKRNRLVDETGGKEKYQRIEQLEWNKSARLQGKSIKIKGFPTAKKVMLFRVTISTNRTEYIATNEVNISNIKQVKKICSFRWKIEEFHFRLKQLTGIESCQCRKARIQRNHIACAILVGNFLKQIAHTTGSTVYQLKNQSLSNYLTSELQKPSLTMILD